VHESGIDVIRTSTVHRSQDRNISYYYYYYYYYYCCCCCFFTLGKYTTRMWRFSEQYVLLQAVTTILLQQLGLRYCNYIYYLWEMLNACMMQQIS